MSETLVKFTTAVRDSDGKIYWPQACGRVADDGLWEGWIEFTSDDGHALRSGRETQQPNRNDLFYWAQGLSDAYLEGALSRAIRLQSGPPLAGAVVNAAPRFDRPAEDRPIAVPASMDRPVLDPFKVYDQGENILRGQLRALSRDNLRNIARGYGLVDNSPRSVAEAGTSVEMIEQIVGGVKSRRREGVAENREFGSASG